MHWWLYTIIIYFMYIYIYHYIKLYPVYIYICHTSTPRTSNTPPGSLRGFPGPRAHRRGAGSGPERRLKMGGQWGFLPGDCVIKCDVMLVGLG